MSDRFTDRLATIAREDRRFTLLEAEPGREVCGSCARQARICLVEDGAVKHVAYGPTGKTCVLDIYGPGELCGQLDVLGVCRSRLVAMRPSRLRSCPRAAFGWFLAEHSLQTDFTRHVGDALAERNERLVRWLALCAEQRLADALLRLAAKLGCEEAGDTRVHHMPTHQELSEMIGTTRPRVTCFIKRFVRLGLVRVTRHTVTGLRVSALESYLSAATLDGRISVGAR